MSQYEVHHRTLLGGAFLAILASCSASRAVTLGETQREFGTERACGSRPSRFERRLGAARITARTLACAAQSVTMPESLDLEPAPARELASARCEAESQCYDGFHVTGDAHTDVAALAERCGRACGMTPLTRAHEDATSEGGRPHVYAIELDAATCYRFFAVAEAGVDVLAAAIADSDGNVIAIDNSRDRAPILGPRVPFCPSAGGKYRLVVAAARGEGRFVVQAWSRPRTPE